MKRIAAIAAMLLAAGGAGAAGPGAKLYHAPVDLGDQASLQRGARTFVNYCLSCHSASFMRFSHLARDLGLTEEQVENNLLFVTDKIGDTMQVALRAEDAERWFGVAPPDLSVIARARGADWLYTFLLTFYEDPARPNGVNNLAFPDTAMPHVLWELQGLQRPIYETVTDAHGEEHQRIVGFELAVPGSQDEAEYRRTVADLVTFLVYLGEPAKLVRTTVGAWVLVFLVAFTILAYLLKREYWKDVH